MDNYFNSVFNEEFSLEVLRIMNIEIPIMQLVIGNTEIIIFRLFYILTVTKNFLVTIHFILIHV